MAGQGNVCLVDFVTGVMAVAFHCRKRGLPRAHERVQDDFVLESIELDQAARQLERERSRMADLAGRFGGEIPDGFVVFKEFIAGDGAGAFFRVGPLEGVFAEDQNVFMHIPQDGVAGRFPAPPGGILRVVVVLLKLHWLLHQYGLNLLLLK